MVHTLLFQKMYKNLSMYMLVHCIHKPYAGQTIVKRHKRLSKMHLKWT